MARIAASQALTKKSSKILHDWASDEFNYHYQLEGQDIVYLNILKQ